VRASTFDGELDFWAMEQRPASFEASIESKLSRHG